MTPCRLLMLRRIRLLPQLHQRQLSHRLHPQLPTRRLHRMLTPHLIQCTPPSTRLRCGTPRLRLCSTGLRCGTSRLRSSLRCATIPVSAPLRSLPTACDSHPTAGSAEVRSPDWQALGSPYTTYGSAPIQVRSADRRAFGAPHSGFSTIVRRETEGEEAPQGIFG